MAREFRTKVINIKFTIALVLLWCRNFPYKRNFHDSRRRFMMVRDTSFKRGYFHKTVFEICQQTIDATSIFFSS